MKTEEENNVHPGNYEILRKEDRSSNRNSYERSRLQNLHGQGNFAEGDTEIERQNSMRVD